MLDVPNHLSKVSTYARAELSEREVDHLAALAESAETLQRDKSRTRNGARKVLAQIGVIGNGINGHRHSS